MEREEFAMGELHFGVGEEAMNVVQRGGDGDAELRAERSEVVHDLQRVAHVHARVQLGERAGERGHLADVEAAQKGGLAEFGGNTSQGQRRGGGGHGSGG